MSDTRAAIDLRAGFRRAGSTLFWLSAAFVMMLWGAQKLALLTLGPWLSPLAFVILLVGFSASTAARAIGMALSAAAASTLATAGAKKVSGTVAQLGWLPRLFINLVPGGGRLMTLADVLTATQDGSFAEGVRGLFQTIGAIVGGGIMGVGIAAAGWQWWHGARAPDFSAWLVVAGIGALLMALFFLVSGWVARGFDPIQRA